MILRSSLDSVQRFLVLRSQSRVATPHLGELSVYETQFGEGNGRIFIRLVDSSEILLNIAPVRMRFQRLSPRMWESLRWDSFQALFNNCYAEDHTDIEKPR